jgi:hypothetical protein
MHDVRRLVSRFGLDSTRMCRRSDVALLDDGWGRSSECVPATANMNDSSVATSGTSIPVRQYRPDPCAGFAVRSTVRNTIA